MTIMRTHDPISFESLKLPGSFETTDVKRFLWIPLQPAEAIYWDLADTSRYG
jgi:hypothetical protein